MRSSVESADPRPGEGRLHILSAGVPSLRAPVPSEDPYRVLDDLMAVVEALCPVWPPREIDGPMNDLRL
jgi:hypothetical protein